MKKLKNIFAGLLVTGLLATGCESMLDVKSDRLVFPDDNVMDSPNDTIYSMVAILSKAEKLADRYVLLGELRGDLMSLSDDAIPALREIYNFNITKDNPFNSTKEYYAVINQCNYLIHNVDTSIVSKGEKVMYKEYTAAKAFRAWAYMQLALNYGTVKYYTEPILTIKDAEGAFEELSFDQLAQRLIADLEPVKIYDLPGVISLGTGVTTDKSFFYVRALLGDLYLWTGQYESAAREYHTLMVDEGFILGESDYVSTWTVNNSVFVERDYTDQNWLDIFTQPDNSEQITYLAGSTEFGSGDALDSLTWKYQNLIPSQVAYDNWDSQTYYETSSVTTLGDLRGEIGSYLIPSNTLVLDGDNIEFPGDLTQNTISKFYLQSRNESRVIVLNRSGLLYLRYAEAVNRAGKPNLAFAVLKNGMNNRTILSDNLVPPAEKYQNPNDTVNRTLVDYVDFSDPVFNEVRNTTSGTVSNVNTGVHARGCGNMELAADFIIPDLPTLEDSILYVEDKIVEELALETAFEGNRFQDLMRISERRGDPGYLADKVSDKYGDKAGMRAKLMDKTNWYLK